MGDPHPAAKYRDLIEVLDDDARWGNEPARLASEAIADLCAEITRLSAELAEANAALAWCLAMPPEDVSDANPAVWKAWLSKQPAGYGQAVTRATTPPLAEPPH